MRILTCLTALCLVCSLSACDDDTAADDSQRQFKIGAMMALSGSLSDLGLSGKAAVEMAHDDILARTDLGIVIAPLTIEDSQTDAAEALTLIQQMHADDINIVIGPQSSSEVAAVREFADANDMLVISPSSVARSLSIEGDNIYRLAPDDSYQAEAMTAMIVEDNLDALVILARDDVWGNDLAGLVNSDYLAAGGFVAAEIDYDPATTDFTALISELSTDVSDAIESFGADKVGVYLLSFSEGETILTEAAKSEVLGSVKWYGSSAVAQSFSLISNTAAAEFAQKTGYPCPVFGLDEDARERWEALRTRLKAEINRDPDIYALLAYDALQVIAATFNATGNQNFADFKAAFAGTAAAYNGVTGNVELNAAGDREPGSLDFWSIRTVDGESSWVRSAVYDTETKVLTRQ